MISRARLCSRRKFASSKPKESNHCPPWRLSPYLNSSTGLLITFCRSSRALGGPLVTINLRATHRPPPRNTLDSPTTLAQNTSPESLNFKSVFFYIRIDNYTQSCPIGSRYFRKSVKFDADDQPAGVQGRSCIFALAILRHFYIFEERCV